MKEKINKRHPQTTNNTRNVAKQNCAKYVVYY